MHTYDEALSASTEYFNGDDLAAKVFVDKYALRNKEGEYLESNPEQMHLRMAKEFARIEKKKFKTPMSQQTIFDLFDRFKYIIPQGSPMFGIGNDHQIISLSNCFVLDIPLDSYNSIIDIDKQLVNISKRRGGVGIDLSNLRPSGFSTNNAAKSSTGIVSWMERYSNSIREVGQCIKWDQRVLTKTGFKRICNVQPGDLVWTKEGWVKNLKTINNGKKQLYKVTTESGLTVETSIDHIFQTHDYDGNLVERRLTDFEAGDSIVLCLGDSVHHTDRYATLEDNGYKNSNNKPSNCVLPSVLDEKLAYLLGYSYGDGCVDQERALELACANDWPKTKSQLDYCCSDVQFLKHNELLKQKSANIIFPEKILQSTIDVQIAFICGYFDADGYASGKKRGYVLSSISKPFLQEVQFILNSLGIASKIHFEDRSTKQWNDLYTLCVVGKTSQQRMVDMFAQSVKIKDCNHVSKRECWLTPFKAKSFGVKHNHYSYVPDNSQQLSLSVVNKLKPIVDNVVNNLIIDNIQSIEETTCDTTYDLRLEKEHLFWCEGFYLHNSGRRGALMETLSVHHPDIMEFVTVKNDETKVTGANISVKLTQEFLDAVIKDEEYELRFPVDDPDYTRTTSAKEVWDAIIHSAWYRAEPGLLMWDNVEKEGPAEYYPEYKSVCCNPCQPGWAKVLTPEGIRDLDGVNVGDKIWSKEGWTKITNKWSTGQNKVFKYTTTAGVFYGTEDHRLVVNSENLKQKAKDAESIEIITAESNLLNNDASFHYPLDIMDGLVIGDGSVHKASNNFVGLYIGEDDQDYFDDTLVSALIVKNKSGIDPKFYEVMTTVTAEELPITPLRSIPKRFIEGNVSTKISFLRGLYSANGSVCGNRVTLKSCSLNLIEDAQLMLSSIGIRSYYTTNKQKTVEFDNGDYTCKQSYDLNITVDREKFVQHIGFVQKYKNDKIKIKSIARTKTVYDILSVEEISEEETFDITVDNSSHTYWTQGCNVSNCSEITLSALDSCRLLCLNLFSFVTNPFQSNAEFDFDKFFEYSKIAQRLMDDLVDLESEKIQKIIDKIISDPEPDYIKQDELDMWRRIKGYNDNGRRTGTGITALGDTLAALGVAYGSSKSIKITEQIYKTLKLGCYTSSVDMAEELGAFTIWSKNVDVKCPFLERFKDEDPTLYKRMRKHGRRNIALLTTAPTGSVSILTQTTSGVEPLFRLEPYTRRKKVNPNDEGVRVDFVDQNGDSWQEFDVHHPKAVMWMNANQESDLSQSPWYNCCANDIDWVNRVKMQAAAQKHVCHAISSTINLPNDVDEDTVSQIYQAAFKSGCKGITVYRDGCRTGVLVEKKEEEEKEIVVDRPRKVDCDVYHTNVKGTSYFVLVGLLNNKPYEVFAGKNGFLDNNVQNGVIIKKRKGFYKVEFDDGSELAPITASMDEMEEVISRFASLSLRNGIDMNILVGQLERVGEKQSDLHSFSRAISRTLKKYIPDDTKERGKCVECGLESLVRQSGCVCCMSCGYSRCL